VEQQRAADRERETQRKYERQILTLLSKNVDFSGVVVIEHRFRDGRITGTIARQDGHEEIQPDWKKMSELK
jgi:hypothetical protein